jgi:hypothetical protein
MSKKMCLLICAVLVWALVGAAGAADPSLVGWWKFDDGSGTTAVDSSGNGNHAALIGTVEWVEGIIAGGLHFDGSTAHGEISADTSTAIINKGDFSNMTWFKIDELDGGNQYMFQQGDGNGNGRSWLFAAGDDEMRTFVGGATTGSGLYAEAGEWYHFAFTVIEGGGSDEVQTYVNGEPAGSATQSMETCEGGYFISAHKGLAAGTRFWGILDDLRLYNRALTQEDIQTVMLGTPEQLAANPTPPSEEIDVLRNVVLEWSPGQFAVKHDVYLGTAFADVNNASAADSLGVLVSQGQAATTYDAGVLEFGQTYYWRVDEVNGAPDNTVFKGDVWSFEVEPQSIPVTDVSVTASSAHDEDMVAQRTIDGSGLDALDQHSSEPKDMWLSGMGDATPSLQYEFDGIYKLHEMWVWNSNQLIEGFVGLGAKDVIVEVSTDGAEWTALADTGSFAQAPGTAGYAHNTTIDMGGVMAQYVKLTINSGYGMLPQYGLSEVRFLYIPTFARAPQPADGDITDTADVVLTWRAGREAVSHEVYLGTDNTDLALLKTVTESSAATGPLDYGTTYYWQIVEVNDSEDPASHAGPVWSFSTPAYGTVDNFDQYDDDCNRIFFAWADGLGHNGGEDIDNCNVAPSNGNGGGSIVGNAQSPFAEQTMVHSGSQSMPLEYDNAFGPSEATLVLNGQDWTSSGVQTLSLFFAGQSGNSGQLYVKINNSKISYEGLPDALERQQWIPWNIDLTATGASLTDVVSLTLGIEGANAQGKIYIDDIRLSPLAPETVEPLAPDPGDPTLVAYYEFEGNANDTVGSYHGTASGDPTYTAGKLGQAISLDEIDDQVVHAFAQDEVWAGYTVSLWAKTDLMAQNVNSSLFNNNSSSSDFQIDTDGTDPGNYRYHGSVDSILGPVTNSWTHISVSCDGIQTSLYYNGLLAQTINVADTNFGQLGVGVNRAVDNWFGGLIDDVKIYSRALSQAEIAGLAGITTPFAKPLSE